MDNTIDKIILGDNQFFGVNHLSEARGMETREKFKDIDEIKKMLYMALELGVNGVFFSTHPDIYQITDMIRKEKELKDNLNFYVNVPYPVKYMSMLNTVGPVKTVETVLMGNNFIDSLKMFGTGLKNIAFKDYIGIALQMIDVEVAPFHGLNVKSVLLHNMLCDLLMAYDLREVVQRFDEHVKDKLKLIPGYGTQNYPQFEKFLKTCGVDKAFVMTALNKTGFYMNPNVNSYEDSLRNTNNTVLAMATLASGKLKPEEAYSYLGSIGIEHVVVGLSSREHAEDTFSKINKYIN